jgi:phage terminase large subunit-like protein
MNEHFIWDGTPEGWGAGELDDSVECRWIQLLRERQRNDLRRSLKNDPDFPYYFDTDAAEHVCWFFETQLKHTKGRWAGQSFILEPWQKWDVIAPAFGWKKADGSRRFHRVLMEVARKNAKSSLGAGVGNYLAFGDSEEGAEVFAAATKERQARIVWSEAKRQIKRSPLLIREVKTLQRELFCEELESFFTILGRDSDTEDGLNVHGGLIDEYHAHKDASMLGVLETGTEARENWMIWILSTTGFNLGSPLKDEEDYCKRILEGSIQNETYLPIIYQCDDPEKWDQPEEWRKANPMLGVSVSKDGLATKVQQAKDQPSKKNQFLVKHLNLWASGTQTYIDPIAWSLCGGAVDWKALEGAPCWAAFDLGRTEDLSALCLAFEMPGGDAKQPIFALLMKYWMPEEQDMVQRMRNDEANYLSWIEEGFMTLTPGPTTRTDIIRHDINELSEIFDIQEIAGDSWSAAELISGLDEDGFEVVKHGQGLKAMTFPVTNLRDLVLAKRIRHDDNPILAWNMANAVAKWDASDNCRLLKDESKRRIDGAIAAAMALGRASVAEKKKPSVYLSRGVYVG